MALAVNIQAVGLAAPGLPDWGSALPVLAGKQLYNAEPLAKFKPTLLPANEARRATALVRLAFQASEDALQQMVSRGIGIKAKDCANVFASSGGDSVVMDKLCRTIAQQPTAISPTHFHNSVHNAPAGYWGIATGTQHSSVSLGGHNQTFAKALLESVLMLQQADTPVLLVCYDTAMQPPLHQKKPIDQPFAMAMLLTADQADAASASLQLKVNKLEPETGCDVTVMEALRLDNPAARSLPLLQALAGLLLASEVAEDSIQLDLSASQTLCVSVGLAPQ